MTKSEEAVNQYEQWKISFEEMIRLLGEIRDKRLAEKQEKCLE